MMDEDFMDEAIRLARDNAAQGGRPFSAVLVRDGRIIARAVNRMDADNDPTAHAEMLALRAAGATLGDTRLDGCTVFASGQPCPMCFAAIRIAGIAWILYGYSNENGAPYGLSTTELASELSQPLESQTWASIRQMAPEDADRPKLYQSWAEQDAREG